MLMGQKIKNLKVLSGLVIILMSLMAVRGQTVFASAFYLSHILMIFKYNNVHLSFYRRKNNEMRKTDC